MWILIRWLRQNPADADPQCFQKTINLGLALYRVKNSTMEKIEINYGFRKANFFKFVVGCLFCFSFFFLNFVKL